MGNDVRFASWERRGVDDRLRQLVGTPVCETLAVDGVLLRMTRSEQVRHASLLAVKTRMKSVENIKKITSAMKMVAASKMRTAKSRMEQSRGVVKPLVQFLGDMPGRVSNEK